MCVCSSARAAPAGGALFTTVKAAFANGGELGYTLFRWEDPLGERDALLMAIYDVRDGGFLAFIPSRNDYFLNYEYDEVMCVMPQHVSLAGISPSEVPARVEVLLVDTGGPVDDMRQVAFGDALEALSPSRWFSLEGVRFVHGQTEGEEEVEGDGAAREDDGGDMDRIFETTAAEVDAPPRPASGTLVACAAARQAASPRRPMPSTSGWDAVASPRRAQKGVAPAASIQRGRPQGPMTSDA